MQVRTVEFQEHFARIPLEGARQQDLLQKSADLAMNKASAAVAGEQAQELTRPQAATPTDNPIINESAERSVIGARPRRERDRDPRQNQASDANGPRSSGRFIDFVI
jgi:hypothetical protein